MRRWLIALCLAVLAVAPARVEAQSLFAQGGLGVPVEALDARFRGQGSLGIGLFGGAVTPADPAAAHSAVPTLTVTLQPTWGEFNLNGQTGELQGQRFPVMGAAYHTIHHTTYRHNYGQVFTLWDRFYGTLRLPPREKRD